jgi:hypothetical protein
MDLPNIAHPYAGHFRLIAYIRQVLQAMDRFTRSFRTSAVPFSLSLDLHGNRRIFAKSPVTGTLDLFSERSRETARAVKAHYPESQFHPWFDIFFDFLSQDEEAFRSSRIQSIGVLADNYRALSSQRYLFGYPDINSVLDYLNSFFTEFYRSVQESRERGKSFQRTAKETRQSLMQYSAHLIEKAPDPYVAQFNIHRSCGVHGDTPVQHHEICTLRKLFVKELKKEIPESVYLGYSILLRSNAKSGYWLDAFVFLSGDVLRPIAEVVDTLLASWNARTLTNRAECVGALLAPYQGHGALSQATLATMTLATEPDFYCRALTPGGARRYFPSLSPIGKLAERTLIRKRSAAAATMRQRSTDNPILQDAMAADEAHQIVDRWNARQQKHKKALSTKRTKAAKKRSARSPSN